MAYQKGRLMVNDGVFFVSFSMLLDAIKLLFPILFLFGIKGILVMGGDWIGPDEPVWCCVCDHNW